jgi:hypothetical protein
MPTQSQQRTATGTPTPNTPDWKEFVACFKKWNEQLEPKPSDKMVCQFFAYFMAGKVSGAKMMVDPENFKPRR